jgi:RHS repeat-associated protein
VKFLKSNGTIVGWGDNCLGQASAPPGPTIVERYSYDAFGKPTIRDANGTIRTTSAVRNRFMFTGREYDTETGNYYYRARYYKPAIGRFLQTDPIGISGGLNIYTYCGNNPIMWIDMYGLSNSWNWGWGDIITFYPHFFYDLGAYIAYGNKEFDGSYTGIGYGRNTVETIVTTQVPGGGAIGIAEGGVAAGGALTTFMQESFKSLETYGNMSGVWNANSAYNIAKSGWIGGLTSEFIGMPGIAGRNSFAAVAQQMITKMEGGIVKNITCKTFAKIFAYNMYEWAATELADSMMSDN